MTGKNAVYIISNPWRVKKHDAAFPYVSQKNYTGTVFYGPTLLLLMLRP